MGKGHDEIHVLNNGSFLCMEDGWKGVKTGDTGQWTCHIPSMTDLRSNYASHSLHHLATLPSGQVHTCLRAFALAFPSFWKLFPDLDKAGALESIQGWLQCHLLGEAFSDFPVSITLSLVLPFAAGTAVITLFIFLLLAALFLNVSLESVTLCSSDALIAGMAWRVRSTQWVRTT